MVGLLMNQKISLFTEQDLVEITSIEEQAQINPWSEQLFLNSLKAGHHCWSLRQNKKIIAYAVVSMVLDEAELLTICVAPDYQGQGIGAKLLSFVLTELAKQQVINCFLEVRTSNKAAIALYERMGFKLIGKREEYYQGEDALVYECRLR